MNARLVPLFAAERTSQDVVALQARIFSEHPATEILNRLPLGVVVFNATRQIVYANEAFDTLSKSESNESLLGLRLGEALSCLGAQSGADGCGSADVCSTCRATQALAASVLGQDATAADCSITRHGCEVLENLDFRIWVWRLSHGDSVFHVAVLRSIQAEKRLALMERIFYHDILNLVSGMQGVCELMREEEECTRNAEVDLLLFAVERVSDLIVSQRDFSLAERGEYEITPVKMGTLSLLTDITALMRREASCRTKTLTLDPDTADAYFASDRKLVTRILVNMLKNALEATPAGGVVTAGCDLEDGYVRFWVHNPGVVSKEARVQIFQRTFSTKGRGRGLGTYGMKLFAEHYLGGTVGFTTDDVEGTRFFVRLPGGGCVAA